MKCRFRNLAIPMLMYIALGASNAPGALCPTLIALMGLLDANPTGDVRSLVDQDKLRKKLLQIKGASTEGSFEYLFTERGLGTLDELQTGKTTISGAKFALVGPEELQQLGVSDPAAFGKNAWRDQSGMVWGDLVVQADGSPCFMNQRQAEAYCWSIGAELPSGWPESQNAQNGNGDSDFVRLAKYMGLGTKQGYSPQVLPNLTYTQGIEILSRYFWSSSVPPVNSYDAYFFVGRNGVIYYGYRDLDVNHSVRCVVARR